VFYIFVALLLAQISVSASEASSQSTYPLTVQVELDDYRSLIIDKMPQAFTVREVVFEVDGMYKPEDIAVLSGISQDGIMTREQLLNGLFYIRQLGLFKSIRFECGQIESDLFDLKIVLSQHVVVDYIKMTGFLRNKQTLKNLYVMDPGDIFDQNKHHHSIEHMKTVLQEQGYLQAQIHDLVLPENDFKNVVVRCGVMPGSRFRIGSVQTAVDCVGNVDLVDLRHLSAWLSELFVQKLQRKYYTSVLIEHVQNKVRALLGQQGFIDIGIQVRPTMIVAQHQVNLDIRVTLEKKREFVIWGNDFFKQNQILEHLLLYGKSTWHFPGSIIVDEIEQLYKNKGFFNVHVSVKEERQRMFCFVREGARSSVSAVRVINNGFQGAQAMAQVAFGPVLKARYYDKDLLKKSMGNFIKAYKAAGFWDIKICKEEFVRGKHPNSYEYWIMVDEGEPRLTDIVAINNLGPGHDEARTKFGKTIILGNAKVSYHELMKECTYQEGDDWDKKELEATLKNLKEIKIFDSVQIYPGREVDELGRKPVFIKLIDADRFEIKSSFGLQQVGKNLQPKRGFTYKVGGSLSVNQLFSSVDKWTVYANITRFYRDMGMTYDIPWFRGKNIRCQLKGYDELYQEPVFIGNQASLYRAGRQGVLWALSRTLGRAMLSNSVGVEFVGLYEGDQPSLDQIICYDKKLLGQKIGYLFVEPTFMWRQVDNELNPHRGFVSFISCKGVFDMNHKTSFGKILAEHTQYVPVTNAITAAIRLRAGHVFNCSFEQLHPIERFYLGGPASIRGYDTDYCPPFGELTEPIKDAHAGLPPCANDVWRYAPQGGRTMFNLNTELRCGVYKNFGIVLFTDCGALFKNSIQDSFKNHFFAGSGFGFRYDTPIGPLRIDLGFKWKIDKPDFQSRRVWCISLGQAF